MISYLMADRKQKSTIPVIEFLPEKCHDLSLNLPSELERQLSNDGSVGLALSFHSSVDSIFTLDQEEYLAGSFDSMSIESAEEYKENKIPIVHKRKREENYNETYTKSPTPTKYYELLKENQEIVDDFQ